MLPRREAWIVERRPAGTAAKWRRWTEATDYSRARLEAAKFEAAGFETRLVSVPESSPLYPVSWKR